MTHDPVNAFRAALRFRPSLEVLAYWRDNRVGDTGSAAIDPIDLGPILPYLYLLERDGDRLRYRVSGDRVNQLFTSEHTGKFLDEVVPAEVYRVVGPYFLEVFEGTIVLFKGHVVLPGKEYIEFERVLMPVSIRGEPRLLGCLSMSSTARILAGAAPEVAPGFHFYRMSVRPGSAPDLRSDRVDMTPVLPTVTPSGTAG